MIAGKLEIQLAADLARLTKDMGDARRIVGGAAKEMEAALASVKSAAGALGVALSVTAVAAYAKSIFDATSRMKELGQEAGTTASAISRFDAPARAAGSSVDFVATAMFRMSQAALEARDPSSKAAQALRAIGISTQDLKGLKPDEMFELVARQLAKYNDGLQKNGVMQEVFSKSGREANRVVAAIAESTKLAATVTNEEAEAASKLKQEMVVLQMESERTWRSLISEGVPALTEIIKAFNEGRKAAGFFQGGVVGAISAMIEQASGPTLEDKLKKVNEQIALAKSNYDKLRESVAAVVHTEGEFADRKAEITRLEKLQSSLEHQIFQEELDAQNARAVAGQRAARNKDPNFNPQAAAAAMRFMTEATKAAALARAELANGTDILTASERKLIDMHNDPTWKLVPEESKKTIDGKMGEAIADEKAARSLKFYLELNMQAMEVAKARGDALEALSNQLDEEAERLENEAKLVGLTSAEREKAILLIKKQQDMLAAAGDSGAMRDIEQAYKRMFDAIDNRDFAERQLSTWNELADRGAQFFTDIAVHGKNAFDALKDMVKQLLAEMIALFAKRFILQLGASLTGSTALGAAAGAAGQGTVAGSLLGGVGSYLFGNAADPAAILASGGAEGLATEGLIGAGGFMATMSEATTAFLAAIGPLGWIAAGVGIIAGLADHFRDHENWRAQLGFGPNANAYTTQGAFGPEGFHHVEGDDAFNRQMQAFMAGTGVIDRVLLGILSSGQIATITANLGGAYTTRANGMPAEMSFPPGDNTVAQQLTLEYLQHKYGIVFAEIDKTFADQIAHWTGSAEDLLQAIGAEAGVIAALKGTGLHGLNIESLRAMQHSGETITQTFTRVQTTWAQFTDAFTSDARKLEIAQQAVASFGQTLAAAGYELPTTNQGWFDLASSLDLSTESGRNLFNQMMALSPAFATVTNAAQAAVDRFNVIAGSLSPGFGQANARGTLEAAVNAWRSVAPGNASRSVDQTISDIASLISSNQLGSARTYAQALGGNALDVLNSMLSAYQNWINSQSGPASAFNPAIGGIGDLGNAAEDAARAAAEMAQRMQDARDALKKYVEGLLLDPRLTTLTPQEQLAEARRQYESTLTLAQGGDLGAMQGLSGVSDAYLRAARDYYASSGAYVAIFDDVVAHVGALAGLSHPFDSRTLFETAMPVGSPISSQADIHELVVVTRDLLAAIASGNEAAMEEQNSLLRELLQPVANADRR